MPNPSPAAAQSPANPAPDRPILPAMLRGWRRCCPQCGEGPMLRGYLTVRDTCPACGEELHHHRADDGPAYLTILVVGHIVIPMILWSFLGFRPDPLVMLAGFSVLTVALTLWLLPRIKGAFIALQWSRRMHGFGGAEDLDPSLMPGPGR